MISVFVYLVQVVGIVIPLAGCVSLFRKLQARTAIYLFLANLGCLINNGSYLLLLQTATQDGALAAWKMGCFGNVVFYLAFAVFLGSYLKIKGRLWVKALFLYWCIQDMMFLIFIWSGSGMQTVFQSLEFQWIEATGFMMIRSVPGVLYMMRYSTICMMLVGGMAYTSVRMFAVKIKSEREKLARLAGAQFVIFASLVLMLFFNFPFDIVPVCASVSLLSIVVSVMRDEFFGVTESGRQWVFEQMEDAFVIVDQMYGYLDANAYAKEIFPELYGRRKNETVSEGLRRLFTETEPLLRMQGRHYQKTIMELKDKGEVSGYSLFLADITKQQELMERVREEKERADAANQAKSAFVSNVSHEIRTPMNAIVGMTQVMLRKNPQGKEREYLMNIQNSGNALLSIINDLLDLSKMESGKMELVEEEYDFFQILSDLGMILLNRIGNKPVELLFDVDKALPKRFCGDALRIRQIIINLMNNAVKFTERGSVCLTVKALRTDGEDMELLLSVSDTGQGIRPEDMDKLFGAFQQVDAEKNHHKEGTGLGLSISKQFVEMMGGSIGVRSEYGKGSEFYFTIRQKIADGTEAVGIPDGCDALIAGKMGNLKAEKMLKTLAEGFGLSYVENIMSTNKSDTALFYFTDCYEELSKEEKERLSGLGAAVCRMVNPMFDDGAGDEGYSLNKPLYAYNFCSFLAERMGFEKIKESAQADNSEFDFTAPDACILIVDDNEINRMVAEEILKPLQAKIELAADGRQALEIIKEKKPDLVLMDHIMPVMDGVEAAKAVRSMDGAYYGTLPIIALTGNTEKEQREEYDRAGMSDYLAKPIDMEDLYRKVKKWMPDKVI